MLQDFIDLIHANHDHNVAKILALILAKLRRTTLAEGGSIYVVDDMWHNPYQLKACSLQNDKIDVADDIFFVPINDASIAGYVATTAKTLEIENLYALDSSLPFEFNPAFDEAHGYKSLSMLVFPLLNFHEEVIGVVQLINHVNADTSDTEHPYTPFPHEIVKEVESVSTVLGAMVERMALREEINRLRRIIGPHA